jgi:hypothetical protein
MIKAWSQNLSEHPETKLPFETVLILNSARAEIVRRV